MHSTIIFTLLWIIGFHVITRDGMVFGFVERFWKWKNPEWTEWEAERERLNTNKKKAHDWVARVKNQCLADHGSINYSYIEQVSGERLGHIIAEYKLAANAFNGFLTKNEPSKRYSPLISKPLSECPTCMASVHGSLSWLSYSVAQSTHWVDALYDWPIFMVCLAGAVDIVTSLAWKGGEE